MPVGVADVALGRRGRQASGTCAVDWRFISLRLLNADKDYERDFAPGYVAGHTSGLKLLRVAAAVRAGEGRDAMGDLYTRFGGDIHVRRRRKELTDHWEAGFPDYLRSVGIDERYVAAANDPNWDEVLQAETDEALSRTGRDVGTPIITFHRDGPATSRAGDQSCPPRRRGGASVGCAVGGGHLPRDGRDQALDARRATTGRQPAGGELMKRCATLARPRPRSRRPAPRSRSPRTKGRLAADHTPAHRRVP